MLWKRTLIFGTWNVRSLNSPGVVQRLFATLKNYQIQLVAMQEMKWPGKGKSNTLASRTFIVAMTRHASWTQLGQQRQLGFAVQDDHDLLSRVWTSKPSGLFTTINLFTFCNATYFYIQAQFTYPFL